MILTVKLRREIAGLKHSGISTAILMNSFSLSSATITSCHREFYKAEIAKERQDKRAKIVEAYKYYKINTKCTLKSVAQRFGVAYTTLAAYKTKQEKQNDKPKAVKKVEKIGQPYQELLLEANAEIRILKEQNVRIKFNYNDLIVEHKELKTSIKSKNFAIQKVTARLEGSKDEIVTLKDIIHSRDKSISEFMKKNAEANKGKLELEQRTDRIVDSLRDKLATALDTNYSLIDKISDLENNIYGLELANIKAPLHTKLLKKLRSINVLSKTFSK